MSVLPTATKRVTVTMPLATASQVTKGPLAICGPVPMTATTTVTALTGHAVVWPDTVVSIAPFAIARTNAVEEELVPISSACATKASPGLTVL